MFKKLFLLVFFLPVILHAQTTLPDNMYADTIHAPFFYGVTSGDPTPNRVIIWTHITPTDPGAMSEEVNWEMAEDEAFNSMVTSGTFTTNADRDWTVKVDVDGLAANTTYFYRFSNSDSEFSAIGRTRTAPEGAIDEFNIAIASCSSIYSGYFNAYKRISERSELNLVIHLGDYLYDFVDEDEQVRVPDPYPTVPQNLDEWRDRHQYYALDPDFRAAKQQHPWVILWDNHDLKRSNPEAGAQAFWEWTPTRRPDSMDLTRIYRTYSFGDLLDIFMMDFLLHRDKDTLFNGAYSALGAEQYQWLIDQLLQSEAQWKVIGNQKMFGLWSALNVPQGIFPTDGPVYDSTAWDGYGTERMLLMEFLDDNNIENTIVLSGDAHISIASDLALDPLDPANYNPETGEGSIAVEFLPTSISRGNLDELGFGDLEGLAELISQQGNPHQRYIDVIDHGYGKLSITPDSASAQFWYSEILEMTDMEDAGERLVVLDGDNHWRRPETVSAINTITTKNNISVEVFPNPASKEINVSIRSKMSDEVSLNLLDAQGKQLELWEENINLGTNERTSIKKSISHLPAGVYLLFFEGSYGKVIKKIYIQ